eukprot:Awhi_evm1s11864
MLITKFLATFYYLTCLPTTFGQRGVNNILDALDYGIELTKDFSNGKEGVNVPEDLLDFAGRLLETSHLHDGVYSPLSEPRRGLCNGENESLELGDGLLNYTVNYDHREKRRQQRQKSKSLPDPTLIFERLLKREGTMTVEKTANLNFLWVSWVNFYFEDTLRTKKETNGAQQMDSDSKRNNLAMIYGRNKKRENLLRSFIDGKLRVSLNKYGEEVALLWDDVLDVTLKDEANLTDWQLYVLGDDDLNTHWGHVFWVSIYTREHNRVCDELLQAARDDNSDISYLTDDRLFQMARVIMTTRHARSFLENFASDLVLQSNNIFTRFPFSTNSCNSESREDRLHREPVFSLEYVHAYTFHHSIPDYLYYDQQVQSNTGTIDTKPLSLADNTFRNTLDFNNYSIQEHADAFYRSPAGDMQGKNVPAFLGFVFVNQLLHARTNAMASYKDYVEYYSSGKETLSSFEDMDLSPELTKAISELYTSVDDVDFYVGMQLEKVLGGGEQKLYTRTSLILGTVIASFLGATCYDDSYLYTEEFLSKKGMEMINGPSEPMWDLMYSHVELKDNTPFSHTLEWGPTGKSSLKDYQLNAFENSEKKMSHYSASNLADYSGLNSVWDYALQDTDEYLIVFVSLLGSMVIYVIFHFIASWALNKYVFKPRMIPENNMALLTHFFVFGTVLTLQMPVYTYVFILTLFSDRLDEVMPFAWPIAVTLVSSHAVLFIADIGVRRPKEVKLFITLHHLCWVATYLIPLLAQDVFTLKVGMIADYFTVYEGGLYLLMFVSKLQNRSLSNFQAYAGRFVVCLFGITRLLQFALLISAYALSFHRMVKYELIGIYVFSLIIMILVVLSQCKVLHMYLQWPSLWHRSKEPKIEGTEISSKSFVTIEKMDDISLSKE